ncbi:MAG: metallophosphoesterase [Candidatus Omnitrophota bacterium]|nr:metallophosphoesterase [Candidatus Omnitrophota bacterium]
MFLREAIAVSIFLIVVGVIYLKEIHLLTRFIYNRLRKKQEVPYFFAKRAVILHLLALVGVFCILYGYFIEPYRVEIKKIDVFTEKFKNAKLKLVQISDLHCDIKIRNEYKLIEKINALKPDIIVFTGDTINTPEALPLFKSTMRKLKANIAKLAVKGNFDVWDWGKLDLFSGTDFTVLDEEVIQLEKDGELFFVSGLSRDRYMKLNGLLKKIPSGYYSIFLYHSPGLAEDLKGLNVDLYLCGHTHAGQVALPFYGALVTLSKYGKKYESGKYIIGNTMLYVNRGIGMEGGFAPRVRFFSRPEITVFNIKPKR